MKLVMKMLTAVAICALAVGVADAQGRGQRGGAGGAGQGRGGMGGGGVTPITLVQNKDVQDDVKATDEQKSKLTDWAKEAQTKYQAKLMEKMQDVPMEERMTKMPAIRSELNKDLWKEIDTVLKPEQTTRVKQIYVQALAIGAFTDVDVVEKLKLADDQKEKIKTITTDFNTAAAELRPMGGRGGAGGAGGGRGAGGAGGAGGGRGAGGAMTPENQKKMDELTKTTLGKVKEVLKDDQKKTWDELTGKEFDITKLRPPARGQ
jgi:hypothetical protein